MQPRPTRSELVAEERETVARYRASRSEHPMPMPREPSAAAPTFVHGFLLPFALVARTFRDPFVRGRYLRLILVRAIAVAILAVVGWRWSGLTSADIERAHAAATGEERKKPMPREAASAVRKARAIASAAGVPSSKLPPAPPGDEAAALRRSPPAVSDDEDDAAAKLAVLEDGAEAEPLPPPPGAPWYERALHRARADWKMLVAFVGFLSILEAIVVVPSRQWDDWISFHASRHARVLPETLVPPKPRLTVDFGYLKKKLKRRIRGYVVFLFGIPLLAPFKLVPNVGDLIFTVSAALWAWYWLGVFAASKSAHAWADEAAALPPAPLLFLQRETPPQRIWEPVRWYARLWTRLTRSIFPAVTTFERAPRAYLGLALARAILAFPLLYFFARPLVPVAASRLCAETDPSGRFDARY